jgi:hypothetical protein
MISSRIQLRHSSLETEALLAHTLVAELGEHPAEERAVRVAYMRDTGS